jgi:serine-type D-Ala-D-Ala endopeptidase (penicillin-binding protein 7)
MNTTLRKLGYFGNATIRAIGIFAVFGLVIAMSVSFAGSLVKSQKVPPAAELSPETIGSPAPRYNSVAFDNIQLIAKSHLVYDPINKEVLDSNNAETVLPLASVTKVVTAMVAHSRIAADETIKIQASDLQPEGDSSLRVGDVWQRDELLQYMLSVSSNDAARALARTAGIHLANTQDDPDAQVAAFVAEMNLYASKKNLATLKFTNESGLDTAGAYGGVGSARDVALLLGVAYFEAPNIFDTTTKSISYASSLGGTVVAKNTNKGASSIPGLTISKTGYTDAALGNLGVVVEIGLGHPIVIVVLHSGRESRFSDVDTLYRAVLRSMK